MNKPTTTTNDNEKPTEAHLAAIQAQIAEDNTFYPLRRFMPGMVVVDTLGQQHVVCYQLGGMVYTTRQQWIHNTKLTTVS